MTQTKPVALTCGDPAGIGPELAALAWADLGTDLPFFLIGDERHLPKNLSVVVIDDPSETAKATESGLPVLSHPFPKPVTPGQPTPENAAPVISAIARGVELVVDGRAKALCTNPIHKKALKDGADFAFPGHTEYLAALAKVDRVVMMLASNELRVVPTTIHISLSDVPAALTRDLLTETIEITYKALRQDFGIENPRLAVAGLNPHAGEGGVMGAEDRDLIAPVVEAFRATGMQITGPASADTMFHAAARQRYDAAIAMYHDQALIPIKTLDFDKGVNVTLGLPFIRTSPDHGTAFDIAGKGIANPSSLIEALKMADRLGDNRS